MQVLLVTGFLGSGKTTFINKLIQPLRRNAGLAILVNDFGKESVSAEYGSSGELEVRYLENGCVCCAIGPSLITTIKTSPALIKQSRQSSSSSTASHFPIKQNRPLAW